MKRIITIIFILLMLFSFTGNCFAATSAGGGTEIAPCYVATRSHTESFNISSSGVATMNVALAPFNTSTIDEVKATLVIKNSSGTNVYNKTHNLPWNSLYASFKTIKEHQLTKKGVYSFQVTYKCYKNGSLVETIKSTSILKSY